MTSGFHNWIGRTASVVLLVIVPSLALIADDGTDMGGAAPGLKAVFFQISRICMIIAALGAIVSLVNWFINLVKGNESAGYQVLKWLFGFILVLLLFAALNYFVKNSL